MNVLWRVTHVQSFHIWTISKHFNQLIEKIGINFWLPPISVPLSQVKYCWKIILFWALSLSVYCLLVNVKLDNPIDWQWKCCSRSLTKKKKKQWRAQWKSWLGEYILHTWKYKHKKKWDEIYVVIRGVTSGKFEMIGKPLEFDALRQINSRFN